MKSRTLFMITAALAVQLAAAHTALAQDKLKIAVGQRGTGESGIPEVGQKAGIFKKHGIDLEIFYTSGTGETIQAVVSKGADLGNATGTPGILSAFQKGAPVRIIGSNFIGDSNLFWYVKADSPIKDPKDILGKTVAYSTNGSSTHNTVLQMQKHLGGKFKATATGSPTATLTQVMSGQIDVGWSGAPFGVQQLEEGKIRMIFRASDVPALADVTTRVIIGHVDVVKTKPELMQRFMDAFRETIEHIYKTPEGAKAYAVFAGTSDAVNARTLKDFVPYAAVNPDKISGLDSIVKDALEFKYLRKPLTKEELAELIRIPPRKK